MLIILPTVLFQEWSIFYRTHLTLQLYIVHEVPLKAVKAFVLCFPLSGKCRAQKIEFELALQTSNSLILLAQGKCMLAVVEDHFYDLISK